MTNGNRPRRNDRLLRRILDGESDANIRFEELRRLLSRLGFDESIRGSHHIYRKAGVEERIDLQPLRDGMAKKYQIRQVRAIFFKYGVWDWLT